jgi:hypothetical protein
LLQYVDGDYCEPTTYGMRKTPRRNFSPLHYLAIPLSIFAPVADELAQAGCAECVRCRGRAVQAPSDVQPARRKLLFTRSFPESAILRIEHFSRQRRSGTFSTRSSPILFLELIRAVFASARLAIGAEVLRPRPWTLLRGLRFRASGTGLPVSHETDRCDRSRAHDIRSFFAASSLAYNLVLRSVARVSTSAWPVHTAGVF